MVEASLANRAIVDALASGGYEVPPSPPPLYRPRSPELLHRAQHAGQIPADITPDDLKALVVGCVAAARHHL